MKKKQIQVNIFGNQQKLHYQRIFDKSHFCSKYKIYIYILPFTMGTEHLIYLLSNLRESAETDQLFGTQMWMALYF